VTPLTVVVVADNEKHFYVTRAASTLTLLQPHHNGRTLAPRNLQHSSPSLQPPIMDEAIDTFTAFTGASSDIARRYLGMTENNTEQAIQLYFDSPDLASGIDRPPQPPQQRAPSIPHSTHPHPVATRAGREDAQGVVHLDSDEDEPMEVDGGDDEQSAARAAAAAADIEDDEAMARRMQEELYAGGDNSAGYDADRRWPRCRLPRRYARRRVGTTVSTTYASPSTNAGSWYGQWYSLTNSTQLTSIQGAQAFSTSARFRRSGTREPTQSLAGGGWHKPQEGNLSTRRKLLALRNSSGRPSNS
jgi:hypothetical protein